MIIRLGELAEQGTGDPADLVAPFVDALLALRDAARGSRDWATADDVRDRLLAAGVQINDTPEGTAWSLHR
jgi:cysteinyl-tRNA synthetase